MSEPLIATNLPALPVTLAQSRSRPAKAAAGCLGFVAAGVWLLSRDSSHGTAWLCILFFGFGFLVLSVFVVSPGALTLTAEGMEIRVPLRRDVTKMAWRDCGSFVPVEVDRGKRVMFEWNNPNKDPHRASARLVRRITGTSANSALPDLYGMTAPGLASLLNGLKLCYT